MPNTPNIPVMPITNDYAESVCEIKSMNNVLVAVGRIKRVTDKHIKIYNAKDELRIINFGEELKINIFNTKLGFKVLVGDVYTSTERELEIANVDVLTDRERRNFFRVDMKVDATVMFRGRTTIREIKAEVLNMSLSGLRFRTDHEFEKGMQVTLSFNLDPEDKNGGKIEMFPCRIVRVIEHPKKYELQYGCEFTGEDNHSSTDALCSFLFRKQREFLNSRRAGSMF